MSSGHTQSPISSNHGTPTSSTTALNDLRNKPLPLNDNLSSGNLHGSSMHPSQGASNALTPGGSSFLPSQHSLGNLAPPNAAGAPSTPTRQGQLLAPSVIISPSAPVGANPNAHSAPSQRPVGTSSFTLCLPLCVGMNGITDNTFLAYSPSRCCRNNAG